MRKLLYFGTGAAVIGIILIVVAFYESYVIVNDLQTNLNSAVTSPSTNLLTEASLQAVFLGVMAVLGYVLIAKGLDGIRKQELVDIQKGTAARVAQLRPRIRPMGPTRESKIQALIRSSPSEETTSEPAAPVIMATTSGTQSSTGSPADNAPSSDVGPRDTSPTYNPPSMAESDFAETPPTAPAAVEPVVASSPETLLPRDTTRNPSVQDAPEPSDEGPEWIANPITSPVEPGEPEPQPQSSTVDVSHPEPEPMPAPPVEEVTQPDAASMGAAEANQVTWEGGAPEPLKEVEVLPEPALHGTAAILEEKNQAMAEAIPPANPASGEPMVKRQRGRPRKKPKAATSN